MTAYVEECRREWKRLGVPDLLAEEMASDLEADLAEAQADGVSAAEILGESDPRRFAAAWASERGLVSEPLPPQKKSRKGLWIGLAVAFVFLVFAGCSSLALITIGTSGSGGGSAAVVRASGSPVKAVTVPKLVGMTVCKAERTAENAGLLVHAPDGPCDAVVVRQKPRAGAVVRGDTPATGAVTLRVRRPGG